MRDHTARPLVIQSNGSGRELESNRREIQLRVRKRLSRSSFYARRGLTTRRSRRSATEEKPIETMDALFEKTLLRIVRRHIELKG